MIRRSSSNGNSSQRVDRVVRGSLLITMTITRVLCLLLSGTTITTTAFRPLPSSQPSLLQSRHGLLPRPPSSFVTTRLHPSSSTSNIITTLSSSASVGVEDDNVGDGDSKSLKGRLRAFYKFTRPHTIRGTILASVMGVLRCLIEHPNALSLKFVPLAFLGMLALLCGNVFIVGINQIYDVDIDKVNKPFLPLAAQQMSNRNAWALVVSSCILGLTITKLYFSPLIFGMYLAGLVAGGVYSIPPFYFKRFPLVAALTIAFVRGLSLNLGVYYAVRESLGIPFKWNPIVAFITRFMTVFAAVIAVSKDLPDTEGDIKYNVNTFAARVGVKNMARGASAVLLLNYLSAIVEGAINKGGAFKPLIMVPAHAILAGVLIRRWVKLDRGAMALPDIKTYYKFIWDLFYLEYCLYPLL